MATAAATAAGSQQLSSAALTWQRGPTALILTLMSWQTRTVAEAEICHHPDLPTVPSAITKHKYHMLHL